VSEPASFHRTLEQELVALARRVSLECLVCGEFVLHSAGGIACPECGSWLQGEAEEAEPGLQLRLQAG
jgi:Zn finger protein HypA/HybF involved in hydrogenase expression